MPSVTTVPGRWPFIGHTVTLLRSPVEFLSSLPPRGDVVRVFLGPLPVHLVTTPELALRLLTSDKVDKGVVFDKMRPLFAAATIATRWNLVPVAGQRVYAQVKATMQPNRLPMTAVSRRPQA